ncbi:hypothetical protein ACLB2K_031597 [Fragaria x ananassa]
MGSLLSNSSYHELNGRLSRNVVMTGSILFNGKKKRLVYGVVAYVTQEDVLLGTLTVRETITYSAYLRLPSSYTREEVRSIVEGTINEMGLLDCADRSIGNWHLRGISDSASAFFVIQTLRSIARDGRTVISSVHQPSSEVFALFDDLFLLSGGETVYFGDAKTAIDFFAEAGVPCPSRRNPSDHFLRCINSDFDKVTATLKGSQRIRDVPTSADPLMNLETAEIKARLVEKYRRSKYAHRAKARMQEISAIEDHVIDMQSGSQASWWRQLSTLLRRSSLNMSRDVVCVGTIFFHVGTGYTAIFARAACGAFITGFMTFMSIGGFPSFIEEMKVFHRERLNGYYGVLVFIISNFLSSFPFLVAITLSTGTITYYLVKFRTEFSHYVYFSLNIFLCISVIESLMMVVASLVPNFLMGIITGAGIMGILMMTAGFFRLLPDLPKPFWRYPISFLSYGSWSIQGAYKNDFLGLEFEPMIAGEPKLSGEYVVTHTFGIPLEHSKWWDLVAILAILVSYRVLFFLILKFKESASPLFQTLCKENTTPS